MLNKGSSIYIGTELGCPTMPSSLLPGLHAGNPPSVQLTFFPTLLQKMHFHKYLKGSHKTGVADSYEEYMLSKSLRYLLKKP